MDIRRGGKATRAFIAMLSVQAVLPAAAAPEFLALPFTENSIARDLSGDGTTVVGEVGGEAYRWTAAGGIERLGRGPDGAGSMAHGVSADGSVVVGSYKDSAGFEQPYRWTAATGFETLASGPNSGGVALDVSADGTVVVGEFGSRAIAGACAGDICEVATPSNRRAFIWDATSGMSLLTMPGAAAAGGQATGISADGSVVTGNVFETQSTCVLQSNGDCLATRVFTEGFHGAPGSLTTMGLNIGDLVTTLSADGGTAVGRSADRGFDDPGPAFMWRAIDGRTELAGSGTARAVNGDGSLIGGDFGLLVDGVLVENLRNLITNGFDLNAVGWSFLPTCCDLGFFELLGGSGLTGVSDDGLTWVGTSTQPRGRISPFVVRIDDALTTSDLAALPEQVENTGSFFRTPLLSAALPLSRAVEVGSTATTFVSLLNSNDRELRGCAILTASNLPFEFSYAPTDPVTNVVNGPADALFNLAPGEARSFVISMRPTGAFTTRSITPIYECANSDRAFLLSALNDIRLKGAPSPTADILALPATATGDGVAELDGDLTALFAVATRNVGTAAAIVTVSARPTDGLAAFTVELCETNSATGECLAAFAPSVDVTYNPDQTRSFAIRVISTQPIQPLYDVRRVRVSIADGTDEELGGTSVAVVSASLR